MELCDFTKQARGNLNIKKTAGLITIQLWAEDEPQSGRPTERAFRLSRG